VDWSQAEFAAVHRTAVRQARLAAAAATRIDHVDLQCAWVGGMVASLGWLAACALDPTPVTKFGGADMSSLARCQRFDPGRIARRLAHAWRLPASFVAVAGRLGLPASDACGPGFDRSLFQVVQLAVLLRQREPEGPRLPVGAELGELLGSLGLGIEDLEAIVAEADAVTEPQPAPEPPSSQPLLVDLLEVAIQARQRDQSQHLERIHRDVDRLQQALQTRRLDEKSRLKALKLSALAEFAAGAGHEINNPLAVISGQAQYLLRQLQLLEGPVEEIDNPAEYLANFKGPLVPSLRKIVAQAQRIHGILTDLMQFARPSVPKLQALDVVDVVRRVTDELQGLADERQVRLVCTGLDAPLVVRADRSQVQASLGALVRNAIEAAPPGGWAGVRVQRENADHVVLRVEDSGPGPGPAAQEHLFDPFFSGRSAGRGRGLGLPTAWRLACQQDGDLRFDGTRDGVTRFSLVLPAPPIPAMAEHANGCNGSGHHSD
jgi:signal transduction histidine kinase